MIVIAINLILIEVHRSSMIVEDHIRHCVTFNGFVFLY